MSTDWNPLCEPLRASSHMLKKMIWLIFSVKETQKTSSPSWNGRWVTCRKRKLWQHVRCRRDPAISWRCPTRPMCCGRRARRTRPGDDWRNWRLWEMATSSCMTIWKRKVDPLAIHNLNFTWHVSMRGRGHVRLWLTISAVIQPYRQRMFQFQQSYNSIDYACFNFSTVIQPCRQRMFQFQHGPTVLCLSSAHISILAQLGVLKSIRV